MQMDRQFLGIIKHMKISITRARRRSLQVFDTVRRGTKVTVTRRGKPSLTLEPDGSIMVREEPTAEQTRAAAQSILAAMRDRAGGETAREALTAVRRRLG
jgi:antitoxin (DNA-binding transcriptional repressor) of toxin-antitoxin stability system